MQIQGGLGAAYGRNGNAARGQEVPARRVGPVQGIVLFATVAGAVSKLVRGQVIRTTAP